MSSVVAALCRCVQCVQVVDRAVQRGACGHPAQAWGRGAMLAAILRAAGISDRDRQLERRRRRRVGAWAKVRRIRTRHRGPCVLNARSSCDLAGAGDAVRKAEGRRGANVVVRGAAAGARDGAALKSTEKTDCYDAVVAVQ